MSILAFTVTRAATDARRATLSATICDALATSGQQFDWLVYDYSADAQTADVLATYVGTAKANASIRVITECINFGQHVAFNDALDRAVAGNYDYLLRLDDDVEFITKQWLVKMLKASSDLGPQFVISPTVAGLLHPPDMSQPVCAKGVDVRFLTHAIGGVCRLHPVKLLTCGPSRYVSDVRSPLGFGDAVGIVEWGVVENANGWPVYFVWLDNVRVRHATKRQTEQDVEYHKNHGVLQHVPFIPPWPMCYGRSYGDEIQPCGGSMECVPQDYVNAQRRVNWAHRDGRIEHQTDGDWVEPFVDKLASLGVSGVPSSILDIGCRTGTTLDVFSKLFGPELRAVGVDIVPEFVEMANSRDNDKVTAIEADAHNLPFGDGEFEWTVCVGTFEHFYNSVLAAKEMFRVTSSLVHVTCDLRGTPLGSDYAFSRSPKAWLNVLLAGIHNLSVSGALPDGVKWELIHQQDDGRSVHFVFKRRG